MTGPTAKSESRRNEILLAAARCFREKGLRATSIADVCAEAGVSTGSLYYFFRTKDALVRAVFTQVLDSMREVFARMAKRDNVLEAYMLDYFASAHSKELLFAQDEATMLEFYAEAARGGLLQDLMIGYFLHAHEMSLEILRQGQRQGQLSDTANIEGLAAMLTLFFAARPLVAVADPFFERRNYAFLVRSMLAPSLAEPLPWFPSAEERELMPACD